ncbi:MAG: Undecaprenyl phosphate-alpha-4-amino-4-deoxy-L-arabinose arabinosyl transferase [Chlamydiales bacterium]|nr:Undecaprenyl phosphate-alpha-4-amino-4-deoxy-L-arabinose arabinosyl transferase [Chlamydiales bacterium]MCH9619444.1 Undecaprenyl phosphate-alpha-4-amino-4-deoxy-L-arabinose arabinosyl transferase [Chlamydiales bacterium]MCH9622248.1 Undecaprenyl phosphate-alpha-4-amino-4-deoxy-L-arabinose arabinosyl transferase [Chlamydiales bacterium]
MFSASTTGNRFRSSKFALLLYILLVKAAVIGILIATSEIHLSPDEAQYWTWSQSLDWGYFSKPPAIAWQIWLTTHLFGNNEFGIRIGAILISLFLALAVYFLAHHARLKERTCFWAAIVMAFCPLGIFLSFAATTDGGSILFLTLAIAQVVRGLHDKQGPNYPLAGLFILIGALYKWTAYIFWPITIVMALFHPKLRQWSLFWGIIISLLALLPSLYWNMNHDFATFKHVGETLYHSRGGKGGNGFDFFFSQVGILSPVFFVLLVISYFYIRKPSLTYCGLFPLLILFYFVSAFFKKMQPNWGDFLYPPATVLIAWVSLERIRYGRFWLHFGLWLSIFGTFFALTIPWVQKHNMFSIFPISYKANPFRQSVGWQNLETALAAAGYDQEEAFLFGDRYQTTSLLSFYVPHKKRSYFFNVNRERKNQFSYTPRMEAHEVGETGYFVLLENVPKDWLDWYETYYPEKLEPYFEKVEYAGSYPLYTAYNQPVKHAIVFKCENYQGTAPEDPDHY